MHMLAPSSFAALDDDIRLAARVWLPVLVTSPDRRERDLCARLIHASGDGGRGPFVTCPGGGAGPQRAHPASAAGQSGATIRHHFEQARGGTLFLDDVTMLTPQAQGELVSVLTDRVAARARGAGGTGSGVRIVAGASRRLAAERAVGAFSELLFYRLNVIHIDLSGPERSMGTRAQR